MATMFSRGNHPLALSPNFGRSKFELAFLGGGMVVKDLLVAILNRVEAQHGLPKILLPYPPALLPNVARIRTRF